MKMDPSHPLMIACQGIRSLTLENILTSARKATINTGVQGIITDYPQLLKRVLDE